MLFNVSQLIAIQKCTCSSEDLRDLIFAFKSDDCSEHELEVLHMIVQNIPGSVKEYLQKSKGVSNLRNCRITTNHLGIRVEENELNYEIELHYHALLEIAESHASTLHWAKQFNVCFDLMDEIVRLAKSVHPDLCKNLNTFTFTVKEILQPKFQSQFKIEYKDDAVRFSIN